MNRVIMFVSLLLAAQSAHSAENDWLDAIRQKHNLPALGAAAMRDGKMVVTAVSGVRQIGESRPVTPNDLWHIGSCTKSMTATLAGVMHDEGKVRWDMKIGEVLPELKDRLKNGWETVTLEQLLTNRAGAPHQPPAKAWQAAWTATGNPVRQRLTFAQMWLETTPEAPPGTKYIYSNQGFALAGAMLEKIARKPYEELLREKVFSPLGMKSAGFGPPGSPRTIDQPRGHEGKPPSLKPKPPGPDADNPIAIAPAGRVHCSLGDFARFASWHARGPLRDVKLMSDETFQRLHTAPEGSDYAMGWVIGERDWAGGKVLKHNGSNSMWYAVMWVAPEKQAAYVAITNCAGEAATQATDEAVTALAQRP